MALANSFSHGETIQVWAVFMSKPESSRRVMGYKSLICCSWLSRLSDLDFDFWISKLSPETELSGLTLTDWWLCLWQLDKMNLTQKHWNVWCSHILSYKLQLIIQKSNFSIRCSWAILYSLIGDLNAVSFFLLRITVAPSRAERR